MERAGGNGRGTDGMGEEEGQSGRGEMEKKGRS